MPSRRSTRVLPCLVAAAVATGACGMPPSVGATGTPVPTGTGLPTAPTVPTVYEVLSRDLDLTDRSRPAGGNRAGRELPTTLWYPSTGAGPFPVVVFSHGLDSEPAAYAELLTGLASAGFVVAAPAYPLTRRGSEATFTDVVNQPADVSFVLTEVLALDDAEGDDLSGRLDEERIAAVGHSAGAITTLGLLHTCCADDRISAAVALAGTLRSFDDAVAPSGVPTLLVHGTADDVVPIAEGEAAYDAMTGPKALVRLLDGSHSTPYDSTEEAYFPVVYSVTVQFLLWALTGNAEALEQLRTVANVPDVSELARDELGG